MKFFVVFAVTVATVSAGNFIINGDDAKPGEAPFIISLQRRSYHGCGASIIHPNWVLTAAHCLIGITYLEVVAGLHSQDDRTGVQIRKVNSTNFINHEKYVNGPNPYDISLIYISEAFRLNASSTVAPVDKVSLPSGNYSETGRGKLFGWGRDIYDDYPDVLQTLNVNIIDYEKCNSVRGNKSKSIDPSQICTYTAGTPDGSCKGDSGGPLVRYTENGVEQVGIVSWSPKPCSKRDSPSVFTRVSSFKTWIRTHMSNFVAA